MVGLIGSRYETVRIAEQSLNLEKDTAMIVLGSTDGKLIEIVGLSATVN
jgi:hypothetical protein